MKRLFSAKVMLAALALTASGGSLGQPAEDSDQTDGDSRLLPYRNAVTPPILRLNTSDPDRPIRQAPDNVRPRLATNDDFVASVQRCVQMVTPDMGVDTTSLAQAGWSYTQPVRERNANGSYVRIDFMKDDVTIALLDFGPFVLCRAIGWREGPQSLAEVRAALVAQMGAVPLREVAALQPMSAGMAQRMPEIDQTNVLISGLYQIELTSQAFDPAQFGEDGAHLSGLTMVMVSSAPLAPRFRSLLPNPTQ